jgi:hypothetical protein
LIDWWSGQTGAQDAFQKGVLPTSDTDAAMPKGF